MPIATTTNDIGFDPAVFSTNGCSINPAIGPGTMPGKHLVEMLLSPGLDRVTVSGSGAALIPDGLVYTCQLRIDANAVPGTNVLSNNASAEDPSGMPLLAGGGSGQLVVTSCVGDCNGNGTVTIGEVTKCINLFLGQPICNSTSPTLSCPVADANNNGTVSIGEVTQCVNQFLRGC